MQCGCTDLEPSQVQPVLGSVTVVNSTASISSGNKEGSRKTGQGRLLSSFSAGLSSRLRP